MEITEGQKHGLRLFDADDPPTDEKGWPLFAERLDDGMPACGSKRSGPGYCESPFRYHNGRCKKHGGLSPKGAASGTWKNGSRSKYAKMPQQLRARYEAGLQDPELTHHRGQIAMIDAALDDFFGEYESGASPELWKAVKAEVGKLDVANSAGDYRKAREHFETLKQLVAEGFGHSQQSLTLLRLLEARRRHADSETKRRLSESMTFSVEQAYQYYTSLGSAARRWFGHDQERLTGFLNEITAISGESGLDTTGREGPAGGGQPLPPANG